MAQRVKNMPAKQKTRVQSLDWKDPLEKGMATHSNILAWRIPWTEEPGRLQPMESQRISIVPISALPNLIYKSRVIRIKVPQVFFCLFVCFNVKIEKLMLKFFLILFCNLF